MWKLAPILAGLIILTGIGAGNASAIVGDPAAMPITQDANKALVKALIRDIDAQGLATTTQQTGGLTRMQVAAKLAPKFLGVIPLLGTAAVLEWKFAHSSWNPAGFIYKRLTGEAYDATPLADNSQGLWAPFCSSTEADCNALPQPKVNLQVPVANGYTGSGLTTSSDGWIYGNWYPPAFGGFFGPLYFCGQASPCHASWAPFVTITDALLTGSSTSTDTNSADCGNAGGVCIIRWRTRAQMNRVVQYQNSDATAYTAAAAANKYTSPGTFTIPATTTDAELEDALLAVNADDATARDDSDDAIIDAINESLDPDWDTMSLPQPTINETYTAYIARLQGLGWVGSATSTVLTAELEGYGPLAPARVLVTTTGGDTVTLNPLKWPAVAPSISIDTNITIRYQPSTAPEAPGTTGQPATDTGTTVTGSPTTIPSAPALDFSPLTGIDFGCKFPYGFVCYAVDFTEQFDVTEDAPVFSFDLGFMGSTGVPAVGEAAYVVDLDVMDDYMDLWRSILAVCLWVGAIYFVATRLLGFNAGGDPGEAIEDVL